MKHIFPFPPQWYYLLPSFLLFGTSITITSGAESPETLSEERTWTSADGKTLSGYLVATQGDGGKFVVSNDSVTLLVDGKPFRLPLDRLSEADREFIAGIANATNNGGFAEFPEVALELTRREEATFFRKFSGLVFPSFAHPHVAITNVAFANVEGLPDAGARASISLSGNFYSPLANNLAHADPHFRPGKVYLTGRDDSIAGIDFEINPNRRTEPKDAEFSVTVDQVEFAAGENLLVVGFPDPVTGLEGREAFSLEVLEPGQGALIGNLQKRGATGSGDIFTYQLTAKGIAVPGGSSLRLCLGSLTDYSECTLQSLPAGGDPVHSVSRPGSKAPNSFCLLPSRSPFDRTAVGKALRDGFGLTLPDEVSEEFQFLVGYAHGVFVNGADVFTSDGKVLEQGATLSDTGTSLLLTAHWRDGDLVGRPFTIPIPAGFQETAEMGLEKSSHPKLMWETAKRLRDEATEADRLERMQEGGFENPDEVPRNWIVMLSEAISEPLMLIHFEMSDKSALQHGFLVGAAIAAAANRSMTPLDPGGADQWKPPTREELNQYVEDFLNSAKISGE